jgi:DNA replication regulator DPB11
MGAEHKLDLTSDVTHLVVGESNTAKYKYVAREREDVKVLKPEWIEAVRLAWLTAEMFDLAAIEKAFKFPPLTGLAVCVTGFEDLAFRSHLQDTIVALGGEYRGDLTKTVTHLIANLPQGKKYQYAEQWKIKVVSLKWLKDTMDRGMVLDESLYHPTLPTNEQGKGAWVKAPDVSLLGKRARDEPAAAEVPRKLRRTASARLGSQSEDLWGDIMGGGFETGLEPQNQLKTSKSLPLMKPVVHEQTSFALETAEKRPGDGDQSLRNQRSDRETQDERSGFFNGMIFYIHGFNARKVRFLR